MGTTKVKITRKATKKDSNTQGTVANRKKTVVLPQKATTSKSRTISKKTGGGNVGNIKSS